MARVDLSKPVWKVIGRAKDGGRRTTIFTNADDAEHARRLTADQLATHEYAIQVTPDGQHRDETRVRWQV